MDTSLTIRPQIGAPSAETVRPAAIEAPAAPSVLPIAKTVPSASGTSPTTTDPNLARNGNPPAQNQPIDALARQAAAQITREVILDPATREVVFRVIDQRSRQVLRQVPDEALMRMRAYNKALQEGRTPADVMSRADVQA